MTVPAAIVILLLGYEENGQNKFLRYNFSSVLSIPS